MTFFAIGPRGEVLPAVVRFAAEVFERCGLQIQWAKTEYFCWQGGLPADSPPDLQLGGRMIEGVFRRGFLCWGVPVGEKEYVGQVLSEKIEDIVSEARKAVVATLQPHRQAAWAALKWSVWSRFEYWAAHCYPSDSILPLKYVLSQELMSRKCHYFSDILLHGKFSLKGVVRLSYYDTRCYTTLP